MRNYILGVILLSLSACGSSETVNIEPTDSVSTLSTPAQYLATDTVRVNDFKFKIRATGFNKELGTDYNYKTADGVYYIIKLDYTNESYEPRKLYNGQFSLRDEDGNQYNISPEGSTALSLDGSKLISVEECGPKIKKTGWLCFEVPKEQTYYLSISKEDGYDYLAYIKLRP
ncbi:DUF4352 domain-containing protein [Daejeonella sp.]|uniref:DUF4352 domain-containing protein n=1 Tax=Daejeonella sp. TaxID=2805397 RepID=UPI0030BA2F11